MPRARSSSATPVLLDEWQAVPGVDPPDLRDYVDLALQGGFPDSALARSDGARQRWLESYLDQLITRDALSVKGGRDPARLRRYFEAYALSVLLDECRGTLRAPEGGLRQAGGAAGPVDRPMLTFVVARKLPCVRTDRPRWRPAAVPTTWRRGERSGGRRS